ncbi:MAG: hypothetical protein Fur0019_13270 [Tibeticola sp.]
MAKKPADPQSGPVRLMVRTTAAHGPYPRYRAGLGPFTREPQVVQATPAQAEQLKADPALAVAEAGQD